MKRLIFLIIGMTFYLQIMQGQITKKNRILAYQIDMTENMNYDSALAYALDGCAESVHLFYTWSSIEPRVDSFDYTFIHNTLDIINSYYPSYGLKAELQLATINTLMKEVPADLKDSSFASPTMISRFKILLDTVFAHIPDLELHALNIGNESDVLFSADSNAYHDYKIFLNAVIPHAKQLYQQLHGTILKVGTTFTYAGLTNPATASLCHAANANLDIVSLTYYPLNPDYTMQDPSLVMTHFQTLIELYPDTLQPIYFAECGYASSETCNSSEIQQAQFFKNVFSAWDTFQNHIPYLTIFKTTDWSQETINHLGIYYGITDSIFLEYLRTLGLRTFVGNGSSKQAYFTLLCELYTRNWCAETFCYNEINQNLSVKENATMVFPNPAQDFIQVQSKHTIKSISIFNSQGMQIFNLPVQKKEAIISTKGLSGGTYFIQIKYHNSFEYQKIMIF